MNSASAIFIKQFQDILKNSGVLIQFIIFPAMAFLMTHIVDIPDMPSDMQGAYFINMFAGMFIGMTLVSTVAIAIAEDREKNSLRFLLMAGVKSHEYLLGVGGVTLVCALVINSIFSIMMPDISYAQSLIMLASMMLGAIASIILGAILGMISMNEQTATSISMAAGSVLGFGPMIANLSGSETLEKAFRILYTMNFVNEDFRGAQIIERMGITIVNIMMLALAFAFVYRKQEPSIKGGITLSKKVVAAMLVVAVLSGTGIGAAIWHSLGFIATDDAKVATTLIPISSNISGVLERFTIYEGRRIQKGEIIGWVENGEAMRSPIDGLVIQTNAVQGQFVSGMEPVAVISDISNLHIQANIEETDIFNIQLGMQAYVMIDTYGNQQFTGYITNIGNVAKDELIPIEIKLVDDVVLDNIIGVSANVRIPIRDRSF